MSVILVLVLLEDAYLTRGSLEEIISMYKSEQEGVPVLEVLMHADETSKCYEWFFSHVSSSF